MRAELGQAYLQTGEPQKALTELKKAMELAPQPYMFNAVASELAEADQQLPLALEYSKRAVTDEGVASGKVSLSQLKSEDLGITAALPAFWGTLGWIYFEMGELDEADKYLNAAWIVGQDATVAEHLAELYERQDKKPSAIHMYLLALDRVKAQPWSRVDVDKTTARLEHLSTGASKPGVRKGGYSQRD